ncbi:MAG TPA: sll0787 family AIR synthase-like protein [Polyangiaceae bacterium]|nr:sll0787 family AIR synthase-like protein [Polyangiaceae bacterium]
MKLGGYSLSTLCEALRARPELELKRDIRLPARVLGARSESAWFAGGDIANGDDTAALPDGDGFTLFAAEGMRPEFVAADPWFAGFCAVMVNLSDVAAMGGRPWAVVDVLFSGSSDNEQILLGMREASRSFGVPIVGGHTTRVDGNSVLAVAVLGRARRLISSYRARPGQAILAAFDLRGAFRGATSQFDAATSASAATLRRNLSVLPELAEAELVSAGKDVSMAGLCGSLAMLLETSGVGARLTLDEVPAPPNVDALRWLTAFPSFGFVLTAEPERAEEVQRRFAAVGLTCSVVGEIDASRRLELCSFGERALYADLGVEVLTGFGSR